MYFRARSKWNSKHTCKKKKSNSEYNHNLFRMNSSIQDIDVLSMALIGRKEVCNHSKYYDCVNVTKHILLKSRGGKRMKNMMDLE